jgi:hypothetical protein
MTSDFRFYALLAVLATLLAMFLSACILAYNGRSVEAIGIGGALTGLIGIAGTLVGSKQQDTVTIDQPENEPVPVEEKAP